MLLQVKIPITEFSIEKMDAVYQSVKSTGVISGTIGVASFLAAVFVIINIITTIKNAWSSDERPTIKTMFLLVWQYVLVLAIVSGMPAFISAFESLLADMQASLLSSVTAAPDGAIMAVIVEIDKMQQQYPDGISLWDGVTEILTFISVMFIAPILAWVIKYLYGMAVSARYLYLVLLEMVAPVAMVCVLYEGTRTHFITWCKNMLVCYLMIPAFMIANTMGNLVLVTVNGDSFSLVGLLVVFFLKLYLIKSAAKYLFQLL